MDLALKCQRYLIGAIFKNFGSDVGAQAPISALGRQRQLKSLSSLPSIFGLAIVKPFIGLFDKSLWKESAHHGLRSHVSQHQRFVIVSVLLVVSFSVVNHRHGWFHVVRDLFIH